MTEETDVVTALAAHVGQAIIEQAPAERVEHVVAEDLTRDATVSLERVRSSVQEQLQGREMVQVRINGIPVAVIDLEDALRIAQVARPDEPDGE